MNFLYSNLIKERINSLKKSRRYKIENNKIIYRSSKNKRKLIGSIKEKTFLHNQYKY